MTRSELVARLADLSPRLHAREAEAVVDAILGRIEAALAGGDRVELRDFGSFTVRRRGAREGRNPRTGASVGIPAKTDVHFKPGRAMRRRLNGEGIGERLPAQSVHAATTAPNRHNHWHLSSLRK